MCRPEPIGTVPRTVAEILRQHVTLEVESIDRIYLNVYVSDSQHEQGVDCFLPHHRGHPVLLALVERAFVLARWRRLDAKCQVVGRF